MLVTEQLLANVRYFQERDLIKGLQLPENQGQLSAQLFAVDNSSILEYSDSNVDTFLGLVEEFCELSGSVNSTHKAEAALLLRGDPKEWNQKYQFKWVPPGHVFRLLGCPVGVDITAKQRFDWFFLKMKKKLVYWNSVQLSFTGKNGYYQACPHSCYCVCSLSLCFW